MRIFVFEYVTGGGMLDSELVPSLVREGDMMLRALVGDLAAIAGIECLILRDSRLGPHELAADCRAVGSREDFAGSWDKALAEADAVWPIVPEHGRALERVSSGVLASGKVLLNSAPSAVRIAASKRATARVLAACGIPTVPTFASDEPLPEIPGPWVLKPDDGVGCLGIRLCRDRDSLCQRWERQPNPDAYVAQPFVAGTAASLSLIARNGESTLLSTNRQRIAAMDDELVLLGCVVNGLEGSPEIFEALAREIAAALPGLWGYAGVDLVDTPAGPQVLEVNPRLTTSYVGLRESLRINPAALVLDLLFGDRPPSLRLSGTPVDVCVELSGEC